MLPTLLFYFASLAVIYFIFWRRNRKTDQKQTNKNWAWSEKPAPPEEVLHAALVVPEKAPAKPIPAAPSQSESEQIQSAKPASQPSQPKCAAQKPIPAAQSKSEQSQTANSTRPSQPAPWSLDRILDALFPTPANYLENLNKTLLKICDEGGGGTMEDVAELMYRKADPNCRDVSRRVKFCENFLLLNFNTLSKNHRLECEYFFRSGKHVFYRPTIELR